MVFRSYYLFLLSDLLSINHLIIILLQLFLSVSAFLDIRGASIYAMFLNWWYMQHMAARNKIRWCYI